jgi:hypothetical protein
MNKKNVFCVVFALIVCISFFGIVEAIAVRPDDLSSDIKIEIDPLLLRGLTNVLCNIDPKKQVCVSVLWPIPEEDGSYSVASVPKRLVEHPFHLAMESRVASGVAYLVSFYSKNETDFMNFKDERGRPILMLYFAMVEEFRERLASFGDSEDGRREYESLREILECMAFYANYKNVVVRNAFEELVRGGVPATRGGFEREPSLEAIILHKLSE